jgi:excisionase family DNA binding protein
VEGKLDFANTSPAKPITVTIQVALSLTGLGRTTFYQLIKEGRVQTITVGRRRLVVFASLEALAQIAPG